MNALQHILIRAMRRTMLDAALHCIGWGFAAAAAAGLVLLLIDRSAHLDIPWLLYWILLGAGALAGVTHAWLTRPDRFELAVQLDRSLHLKDRIGTAMTLSGAVNTPSDAAKPTLRQSTDPAFAELVRRDAQQLAERLDVRSATPIELTRIWSFALPLVGLMVAGVLYLPRVHWFDRTPSPPALTAQERQDLTAQSQHLAEAIQNTVADVQRDDAALDERAQEQLAALDRLAAQLSRSDASPSEIERARDESAVHMNEFADRLAQQAQRELAAAEDIAQRFAGLDRTGAPPPPMSAQEFTEALKRGDFGDAARELDQLLNNQNLTEEQRREAAQHLRDLAGNLDQSEPSPPQPDEPANAVQEQIAQAMRDHGVDEDQIKQFLENPPSQEELERALREQNIDQETAQQISRDLQREQQQQQTRDETQQQARELNEALRQAADELEQSPRPNEQSPQDHADSQEQNTPHDQPRSDGKEGSEQDSQRQTAPQPAQTPERSPSSESSSQQRQVQSQEQPQASPQPQSQESSEQQQNQQQQQQSQDAPQQEQQQQRSDGKQAQQDQPSPQQSSQTPDEQQPQNSNVERRDGAQGEQDQSAQQQQQPSRSPADAMRKLAERRQSAQQRQTTSERMREAAQQLADRTTPQQREQWARQWLREQGQQQQPGREPQQPSSGRTDDAARSTDAASSAPQQLTGFDTEDLDLRDPQTAERIIARWRNDQTIDPAMPVDRTSAPPRIREAQHIAERAVNESAVQRRYHRAIQRYFSNLPQTIDRAGQPTTPEQP